MRGKIDARFNYRLHEVVRQLINDSIAVDDGEAPSVAELGLRVLNFGAAGEEALLGGT